MDKRVLVTGGAGYIGSVVVDELVGTGYSVTVLDNLSTGHAAAVNGSASLVVGDLRDAAFVRRTVREGEFDAVVHLAAESLVGASFTDPQTTYDNNVAGGIALLNAMVASSTRKLVFSSTAAVYGNPERQPLDEDAPPVPVNPYGETKLAFERALRWYENAYGLRHVSLRYFNACGATETRGEDRPHESHLIPLALSAALGLKPALTLYGTDYPTPDGTCVRDYVHVSDIARAHSVVLEKIESLPQRVYNVGSNRGYSNREVIDAVKLITGADFPVIDGDRRPGDPGRLVASHALITEQTGWLPRHTDIGEMVETSWRWRREHPRGYA
jgi:UDP-glucose 4-epimerase